MKTTFFKYLCRFQLVLIQLLMVSNLLAQKKTDIYVKDVLGAPLENVSVFHRENPLIVYRTNSDGKLTIIDEKSHIVFSKPWYETITKTIQEIEKDQVVVLKESAPTIELNEVVVTKPKKKITITELLSKFKQNYKGNYKAKNVDFIVTGFHEVELSDKKNNNLDYKIDINSRKGFYIKLSNIRGKYPGYNSKIMVGKNSHNKHTSYPYTLPFNSSIFLSRQLNFMSVKQLDFIKNTQKYVYEISMNELDYVVRFDPIKDDKWSWSGYFVLSKDNYWIKKINSTLAYTPENFQRVISTKKNSKNPSSSLFYRNFEVSFSFARTDTLGVIPLKLESKSELIHLIKGRDYSPKIDVATELHFNPKIVNFSYSDITLNHFVYLLLCK